MEVTACTSVQILRGDTFEITTRVGETFRLVRYKAKLPMGKRDWRIGKLVDGCLVLWDTQPSIVTIEDDLVEVGKPLVLVMDGHPEQHESVRSIRRIIPDQQKKHQVPSVPSLEQEILAEAKSPAS